MKQILFTASLIFISRLVFSQADDCRCFEEFGFTNAKKPGLVIEFSNGINLSVCGYEIEKISDTEIIISEFAVFNCKTEKSLIFFGALDNCLLNLTPDTLSIKHLTHLPFGQNWKWELKPVTQQLIYPNSDSIIITSPNCIYEKAIIDQAITDQFFSELEQLKGKGYNDDLENIIGKLGVLTLNGNTKARKILNDFRSYIGYPLDGSTSELWNDVISITNFECDTGN